MKRQFSLLLLILSAISLGAADRPKELSFLGVNLTALAPIESEGLSIWTYRPAGESEQSWSSQLSIQSFEMRDYALFRESMERTLSTLPDVLPAVRYEASGDSSILADYAYHPKGSDVCEYVIIRCFRSSNGATVVVDYRRRSYSNQERFVTAVTGSRRQLVDAFVEAARDLKE